MIMRRLGFLTAFLLALAGCGDDKADDIDVAAAERGAAIFRTACAACHGLDAQHKVGPGLKGVVGRKAGKAQGYAYSDALRDADFIWTGDTLVELLIGGETYLPGGNMVISPLPQQDARDVVEYLRQSAR